MIHALILQQGSDIVADWTTGALLEERTALARKLGLHLATKQVERLDEFVPAAKSESFDLLILLTHWKEDPGAVLEAVKGLRACADHLLYLDTFDQSSTPLLGILPHVDLYVKKQLLHDREVYSRDVRGGFIVAEYCAEQGLDLADWHFGSVADPDQLHKLMVGWNLGAAPRLRKRLRFPALRRPTPWNKRSIDVHYRVSLGEQKPGEWYTFHRRTLLDRVRDLRGIGEVLAEAGSGKTLSVRGFRRELRQSRICVSPFGYGEVTDRDYEIVLQGGLLLKPDMGHLETAPDIYRPGETYVPVRWDGADLQERCDEILADPRPFEAIARRAREVFSQWFERDELVTRFGEVLDRLALRV